MTDAGTFPALYYHLSLFFSDQELSFAYAILLSALSISQIIGGPLAGGLQYLAEKGGLHGYQWLFIIEGALTVLWGLVIWVRPSYLIEALLGRKLSHSSNTSHRIRQQP